MRNSTKLLLMVMVFSVGITVVLIDIMIRREQSHRSQAQKNRFQQIVSVPDLGITTAARYLRHYSLSDSTSPFQDYPVSREHFPAGFVFAPPDYSNMSGRISLKPLLKR